VLAVGVGCPGLAEDVQPGDEGGIGRQGGLNLLAIQHLSGDRSVVLFQLMSEVSKLLLGLTQLTQQFGAALAQLRRGFPAGRKALEDCVEALNAADQLGLPGLFGRGATQARAEIVESATGQALFIALPGVRGLAVASQHGGQEGERRLLAGFDGPLQPGGGEAQADPGERLGGTTPKLFGLGVLALLPVDGCQVVVAGGGVGMLLAQHLTLDGQRLATALFGLGVLALGVLNAGEVVVAGGGLGMLLSEDLTLDGQRLAIALFGLGVLPLVMLVECQVVVAGGGVGMLLSQHLAEDGQGLEQALFGLGVLALVLF
jgi:hypothetical protein